MKQKCATFFLFTFFSTQLFSQNLFCNSNFDSIEVTVTVGLIDSTQMPCWHTTATDNKMEVWANGSSGVPSYSGIQFMELNAYMPATLYQNIVVSSGTNLVISFAHRGRGGIDTMSVSVGPVGGPYTTLGYFGDADTEWGYHTVNYIIPNEGTNDYSVCFNPIYWALGDSTLGNFIDAVSVYTMTGINTIENNFSTSSFPNPANLNATIIFENPTKDNFILFLYDTQGRLVSSKNEITTDKIEIDKQNLRRGIYIFQLQSYKQNVTGKLIITD